MDRARQLVLQFGWNATAYQILNPGIEHWFSARFPAVVGFVKRGRTWVAAGAPVCSPEHLLSVTCEFEDAAAARECRVCYVAAAERLGTMLQDSPHHARVVLGAQPVWNPLHWPRIVKQRSSLRAQIARARNKHVTVAAADPARTRDDPQLRRCLAQWLADRALPPLHFLVEPGTCNGPLDDRRLLVASREQEVVGFLLASPVPQRNGFLIEQIIRPHGAPNGTAELLIDALMHSLERTGHTYLTMGLVPLSQAAQPALQTNPMWLRALMAFARAHGRRFYHFDGLEQFRTKMAPDNWETIYAISNERRFTPASLHGMLAAFAEGSLAVLVFHALIRALSTEAGWLTQAVQELMGG